MLFAAFSRVPAVTDFQFRQPFLTVDRKVAFGCPCVGLSGFEFGILAEDFIA